MTNIADVPDITINYYVFDKIELDSDGCSRWGYKNGNFCEVFSVSSDDTEMELIKNGLAKCDAPGTETFCVEESNIKHNEDGSWELV